MAVGVYSNSTTGSGSNTNANAASTTVSFPVPGTVTAGDVWICTATFRGGSALTISGVPAGFHLIARVDSGSASTNDVLVAYWYVALGSETGNFASITISASSKYDATTSAFTGANTTSPVVAGSTKTASGTTSATTASVPALSTGQAAVSIGGQQGGVSGTSLSNTNSDALSYGGSSTSGGSAATNVGLDLNRTLAAADAASQAYSVSPATTTCAVMAFLLDQAAAGAVTPNRVITGMSQPVHRSTSW